MTAEIKKINRTIAKIFKELIKADPKIINILKKLTFDEKLELNEKTYILSIAILFLDEYQKDKRYTTYFEFSYYLILKYSLIHDEYQALYDLSLNYGFFPISVKLINLNKILNTASNNSILDIINESIINKKFTEKYTKTLQQYNCQNRILRSEDDGHISYSAPTSFGKSEIILAHLDSLLKKELTTLRVGIIIPTRSLLIQTYRKLTSISREHKIKLIQHDEMLVDRDQKYIAVLTQERALRILEREGHFFDVLYIDEAHNIFKKDNRSILLARVIRLNYKKNKNQKVLYFSPVVQDANSLVLEDSESKITELKICFNIKDVDIFEYNQKNGVAYRHNRFLDYGNLEWISCNKHREFMSYILDNLKERNFFYINRPVMIERFASELAEKLPSLSLPAKDAVILDKLINDISNITHKYFYPVELLKKGIVYLHGKMPSFIKEYLEYCYQKYDFLKYLVANTVILQGITLPIDNLFILNVGNISTKSEMLNLIGRVNRLNYVFSGEDLSKLICPIYFIDSDGYYSRKNGNMRNQISFLKSKLFQDGLENPLLIRIGEEKNENPDLSLILERERLVLEIEDDKKLLSVSNVRKRLLENSIYNLINLTDEYIATIIENIRNSPKEELSIIHIIYNVFFNKLDVSLLTRQGNVLSRFIDANSSEKTIIFYERFVENRIKQNYQTRISLMIQYFETQKEKNPYFYIGEAYGDTCKYGGHMRAYINLREKDSSELVNYAIVKLKMEDDFVDFELTNFIQVLYSLDLITEDQYNLVIYGTIDQNIIELAKAGLTSELRMLIEEANLIDSLYVNELGILETKNLELFDKFKSNLREIQLFELERLF